MEFIWLALQIAVFDMRSADHWRKFIRPEERAALSRTQLRASKPDLAKVSSRLHTKPRTAATTTSPQMDTRLMRLWNGI